LNQISKILAKEMKMYLRITFIFNDAIHRVEGGGGQLTKTQLAKNILQVTKKQLTKNIHQMTKHKCKGKLYQGMKGGIFLRQISLQICDWSKTQQITLFLKTCHTHIHLF